MAGLKKLISRIGIGKGKHNEPAVIEGHPPLRRANARLRKSNKSSTNVWSEFGGVDNRFLVRADLQCSRQNSFEPGESENDFEAEPHISSEISKVRSFDRLKPHPGVDGSLRSTLGLAMLSVPDPIRTPVSLSTSHLPLHHKHSYSSGESKSVIGHYNLDVHPSNFAATYSKDTMDGLPNRSQLSSILRQGDASLTTTLNIHHSLRIIEESVGSQNDQDAWIIMPPSASSKKRGKGKVSAIRNPDWSKVSEGEVHEVDKPYGKPVALSSDDVSPTDSAIALQEGNSAKRYSGKGKSRESRHERSSALGEATNAWLGADDTLSHRVGRHRSGLVGYEETVDIDSKEITEEGENVKIERYLLGSCRRPCRVLDEGHLVVGDEQLRILQEEGDRAYAKWVQEQLEKEEQELEDRLRAQYIGQWLGQEQNEENGLATEQSPSRECVVCGDCKDSIEYPAKAPTEACIHRPATCRECLRSWMASEFERKGCEGIKCPQCPETLQYADVEETASAETFQAYDKLATRNALGDLDEFAWCLKAGCGSGQLNIENKNYMDCASCGYKQCLRHKMPWHSGETCEQYDYCSSGRKARDEEDERKTAAVLDSVSRKCPGPNCGWRIQKTHGCDHMTCKKCKFEFCYVCLASQAEIRRMGNTAHALTCKFHSNNLDVTWPFNMH